MESFEPGVTYFSLDTEADGPQVSLLPGGNTLMQIGCVAYDHTGTEIDSFVSYLNRMPNQMPEDSTVAWWKRVHPTAWERWNSEHASETTSNFFYAPLTVFTEFKEWLERTALNNARKYNPAASVGTAVGIMWHVATDFNRIDAYWSTYFIDSQNEPAHFLDFKVIDLRSFAMARLKLPFTKCGGAGELRKYRPSIQDQHDALADARNQGQWFFGIAADKPVQQ